MIPRKDLSLMFSSYASFAGETFRQWIIAPRLKQNFDRLLLHNEDKSGEVFWSLYWIKQWQEQQDKNSQSHLESYLQEACYWAAKSFVSHLPSNSHSLADCFQTAILDIGKVLKGFNPAVGQKLNKYAQYCFSNLLREHFRCRGEVDICTDWALLRKISEKTLRAALSGQSSSKLLSFILCWKCFKELYVPNSSNTRKLEAPDRALLKTIMELYNSRILTESDQLIRLSDEEMVLQWLQQCAKVVRKYLQPAITSLNRSTPDQEGELIDVIKDPDFDGDLTEVLTHEEAYDEREQQKKDLVTCLSKTIGELDQQTKDILTGYYRQQLTQKELSQQFNLSQPTINRRLNKARQTLLQELMGWTQKTVNISLTPDILNNSADLLEEWLQQYYGVQP